MGIDLRLDPVADVHARRRLGRSPVELHVAAPAGVGRRRPRPVDPHRPHPPIETGLVHPLMVIRRPVAWRTPAMTDPKIETITTIYEAFGRGDVATILDRVTDDVDWAAESFSSRAMPWLRRFV